MPSGEIMRPLIALSFQPDFLNAGAVGGLRVNVEPVLAAALEHDGAAIRRPRREPIDGDIEREPGEAATGQVFDPDVAISVNCGIHREARAIG